MGNMNLVTTETRSSENRENKALEAIVLERKIQRQANERMKDGEMVYIAIDFVGKRQICVLFGIYYK